VFARLLEEMGAVADLAVDRGEESVSAESCITYDVQIDGRSESIGGAGGLREQLPGIRRVKPVVVACL